MQPICYLKSQIDDKIMKKNELERQLAEARSQELSVQENSSTNTQSLEDVKNRLNSTDKNLLSESEITLRENELAQLLSQKGEKEKLEGYEKDVQIKESIAQGEKKNLDTLSATVTVKKKDYDTAYAQYHSKRDVDAALARIQLLPNQLIVRQRYDKVALDELKKNLDRMPSDTRVKKIYETNLDLYNKRYIK